MFLRRLADVASALRTCVVAEVPVEDEQHRGCGDCRHANLRIRLARPCRYFSFRSTLLALMLGTSAFCGRASFGFYGKSYRRGLISSGTLARPDEAILLSPDPLYLRAISNPSANVVELFRGHLSAAQASQLNGWTDDSQSPEKVDVQKFTTSANVRRERAVVQLSDSDRYVGLASLGLFEADNCATWVEKFVPGSISCPLGIPKLCRALSGVD